jgi:2-aminoethylphosphonate-pyruvate transaminase
VKSVILLNPGPVNLSPGVREALAGPDLCHREPEFSALQSSIRQALLGLYELDPKDWAPVLLTGSGTAAVEAMIASLVPARGRLLVLENGVYGERMSRIAQVHGIDLVRHQRRWGETLSMGELENLLEGDAEITHLAMVHHETTTGRLNRLDALGALCRDRGLGLLVDAVSSFGGEALEFENWGIAACAATANKCLHGVPGTAFVVMRRSALAGCAARSLYLDLASYCREQDRGGTPFTQSVQAFYALGQALRELAEEGGWRSRHRRYRQLARQVREGLTAEGVRPLLAEEDSSVVLSAYHLPEGVGYDRLHDGLKERGFVIYAGQGGLAASIFRVSTMGAIGARDLDRFLTAFREVLHRA